MLLFICFTFFYFRNAETACIPMEKQYTVLTAPTLTINILEFPDEHVLPLGYKVTIVCTSNASKEDYGFPKLAQSYWIHFYFNDNSHKIGECGGGRNDNEESKVCTYVIHNASRSDSGNYTCWTQNQMGCTKGSIELVFKETSPILTANPPAEMLISRGGKASMTCKASGFPNPEITWYKDGIKVPRTNTTGVRGLSTLTLEFVTALDQGEYWCQARNSGGWKRSSSTRLTVKQMPAILLHPKNVSVSLKENITMVSLACKATGSPAPMVTWLKSNSTKVNATVLEIHGTSWLILVLVGNEKSMEKYNCVARNSEGEVYSSEATVIITVPGIDLFFYRHPESRTASTGDHVVLTCAVEGSLTPSIMWLKDGLKVVDAKAKIYQGRESSISELHIASVEEQHFGKYACQAANAMGIVMSRDALLSSTRRRPLKGDTSASTSGNSLLLWILVAAAAVLILVVVTLIFLIHKKCRNIGFKVGEEIVKEQRYSNLYINEDAISQQRSNSKSYPAPH